MDVAWYVATVKWSISAILQCNCTLGGWEREMERERWRGRGRNIEREREREGEGEGGTWRER